MLEKVIVKWINSTPPWLLMLEGVAAIIAGVWLVVSPDTGTKVAFTLMGVYVLVWGLASLFRLFKDRREWGWKVFNGVVGILAGLALMGRALGVAFIVSAMVIWILGIAVILLGIWEIIRGIAYAGWAPALIGVVAMLFGILLIVTAVVGAFVVPRLFGVFAFGLGVGAIVAGIQVRKGPVSLKA